ncbi:MAG: NINE protein [Planctomycetota bacterium]
MAEQTTQEVSAKSRLATALLALFLGPFGAHRLYVGRKWGIPMLIIGVISIPLCFVLIGFIPLITFRIWSLVDCIFAFAGTFKDDKGMVISKW